MTRRKLTYVNFNQLRSFYAVAQELSFTKAAELLSIGQPTVTTQVKSLEEYYNIQLFVRAPNELRLTEAGTALMAMARQIFALEERAHTLLQAAGNEYAGHLHIGTVGPFFLMNLLSIYINRYPLMRVTLESANSDAIYRKLLDYDVDVAILGSDYGDPRLDLVCLGEHEICIIVPRGHPWAHRTEVGIEELDGQRMIFREEGSMTRRAFEKALSAHRVRPNVALELGRDSVLEATAAGLGIGTVSMSELQPDDRLLSLSLAPERVFTRSYAACLQERQSLLPIKAFMEMSRTEAPG